jgi:hypothetical protein
VDAPDDAEHTAENVAPPKPGRWARLFELRVSTRRRAAWMLGGLFVAFHALAWLCHELADQSHYFHGSFVSHLRLLPDEMVLQFLFMPIAMHFAIPALLHPGSLFSWHPGFVAGRVFPVLYWSALLGAGAAFVRGRRVAWCLFIAVVALATAPRFVELIAVALSE